MPAQSSKALLVSVEGVLAGAHASQLLAHAGLQLEDVDILAAPSPTEEKQTQLYGQALLACTASGSPTPSALSAVVKMLKPGAVVTVHPGSEPLDEVQRRLVLGGLTDCCSTSAASGVQLLTAKTPDWAVGAKAAISLKRKPAGAATAPAPAPAPAAPAPAAPAPAAPAPTAKAWTLDPDEDDAGDELMDDDELLTAEDRARPAPVAASDCEVGAGRKACANCSCGRAEAEAAGAPPPKLTQDMLDNPVSNCGSCGLGDAFRCAGCPYRGLPAFKPGAKIELPSDFLVADA